MNKKSLRNSQPLRFVLRCALMMTVMMVWMMPAMAQHPFTLTTADDIANGTQHYYLIQSIDRPTFYAIPHSGDESAKVSTTSIPNANMRWCFVDAGSDSDHQYYYIVNSTGRCLYRNSDANDGILIKNTYADLSSLSDTELNKYKYYLTPTGLDYFIQPKGASNLYLNKRGGNIQYANGYYIKASTYNDSPSVWNFIAVGDVTWPQPFTVSTNTEKHYYKFQNVTNASFYLSNSGEWATVSSTDSNENIWYFLDAGTDATFSNFHYYYIVNASTEKYLYYTGGTGNDVAKVMNYEDNDKYRFLIVDAAYKPDNTNYSTGYTIVPKQRQASFSGKDSFAPMAMSDNSHLLLKSDRATSQSVLNYDSHWKIEQTDYVLVEAPTITNNYDGTISLSTSTTGATIYYTINGNTPDNTSTPYSSAFSLGNATVIKAIAYVGSEFSDVSTYNVPQYTAPTISFDYTTLQVTINPGSSGTAYYNTGDGSQADPTTSSTEYTVPFVVNSATTVKAVATHAGYITSDVATLAITQVATPTIQSDGNNAISITTTTPGATIYYTTGSGTPNIEYTGPLTEGFSGVTIRAIAVKENMITSAVGSGSVTLKCAKPIIRRSGEGFTIICSLPSTATIYYTYASGNTLPSDPTTSSSSMSSGGIISCALPVTVKAFAVAAGYNNSDMATTRVLQDLNGSGTAADPYIIAEQEHVDVFVETANTLDGSSKYYKVTSTSPLSFSYAAPITQPFSGNFDGGGCAFTGLSHPLFDTVNDGTVKNVMLKSVAISSDADTIGAIACKAMGYTRIYNCGILPSTADFPESTHSSVVTSGNCAGGLVGSLRDDSRVVNCFSYADVQAADLAAGLVGCNTFASNTVVSGTGANAKYANLRTMVVNCMFYGDITGGTNQYPVYGGTKISNAGANGINSYNWYSLSSVFTAANGHPLNSGGDNQVGEPTDYYCCFPAEVRYLTQVEFHRSMLNSNRELCGWWVGSDEAPSTMKTTEVQAVDKDASLIYKWVVDPNIAPYPILKPFGKYPSIVNGNTGTPWFDRLTANPYEGKQLGILTVKVKSGTHSSAADQTLYLPITDMDTLHYDFGYRKVQLPYFNTIFGDPEGANWTDKYAGNYTDYVVTGWKVTAVNHNGVNSFEAHWEHGYNFADRDCTAKDLYETSNRVFAQGGNYYVPNGVTEITIEAYWGKAIYIRGNEGSYDRVNITEGTTGVHFAPAGYRVNNVNGATIQTTTISGSLTDANIPSKASVYDYALVLVGNVQQSVGGHDVKHATEATRGFTLMSVDLDFDEEPDYCLEWQLGTGTTRQDISPVRFDFLPVVELGVALKLDGSTNFFSLGCYRSKGHFEVTETAFIRFGQFEYELGSRDDGPIILNGGIFDQYTRGKNSSGNHVTYTIVGGHIVLPSFTPGSHVGGTYSTRHSAVNAIGGDFSSFYLTGGYNEGVSPYDDNPHCYIDGGRFGTVAAAYKEGIKGDVTWRVNHALIDEFYGGGMMAQSTGNNYKIVKGNIDVVIDSCIVRKYCGGPKFGDMVSGKTVTTKATGTVFTYYYGAGNGGTNYLQCGNTDITTNQGDNPNAYDWEGSGKLNTYNNPGEYITKWNGNSITPGYISNYEMEMINTSTGTWSGRVVIRTYFYTSQFATTNTGSVSNTLTGCTILNNFYGAGFLGGVTGDVTSTLDSTRVYGSAFGSGYSASVPKVTIYNKYKPGSSTEYDKEIPKINLYTGLITPSSGGSGPEYYWDDHHGSTSSPATQASPATHDSAYYYTSVPLGNLGAVSGNVTITLKGNTKIGTLLNEGGANESLKPNTGNVFGGGDESAVSIALDNSNNPIDNTGNTTVILQEGVTVLGNVYGGGNEGPVGGNSEVIIKDN